MTCIVAITDGGHVWMGGDSFAGDEMHHQKIKEPKVFPIFVDLAGEEDDETMIIGGCGSFRMLQLLKYALEVPQYDPQIDLTHWFVEEFGEAVRQLFKDRGLTQLHDETEEAFYGTFLIGFCGGLYTLQEDFAVVGFAEMEHATGAGEEYALGSLHATRNTKKNERKRILCALEAATEFSPMVIPPYYFVSTLDKKKEG